MTGLTRKQLLAAAAAAGIAPAALRPVPAGAQASDPNIGAMESTIRFKQALAVAYDRLARSATAELRGLLGVVARQEHEHVAALLVPTEYLGGLPPRPPTLAAIERALPELRHVGDRAAALRLALRLERFGVQALLSAQRQLTDAKLIEVTAAVFCCDAQHLALIRRQLGANPIPQAFEAGQTR